LTKKGEISYKTRINLYVKLTITQEAIKMKPCRAPLKRWAYEEMIWAICPA
jgi:hypothetical protein